MTPHEAALNTIGQVRPRPTSPARAGSSDDDDLVRRSQDGDRAAFEELVRRHADRLYAVLLRFTGDPEEAEEAMQDAFLRAWRRIEAFQFRAQFFTWLYRIGINEAKRRAERRPPPGRLVRGDDDLVERVADERAGPYERAEHAALREALERAIRNLEPNYRLPLVLRDVEGLSTAEAAQVMDLGEAAFKSRLHRARMAVREEVDRELSGDAPTPSPGADVPEEER